MESKKKIAIYSPAASGSVGHGFVYAYELCNYLGQKHSITLYTVSDVDSNEKLSTLPIKLIVSNRFKKGAIDKKKFLKYSPFDKIVYGLFRIKYNYNLIQDFFKKNTDSELFHLFEFEYFAAFFYFIAHKGHLNKTILGFHIADFSWIKGRSITVNSYKVILKRFVKYLIKNSFATTIHGVKLKEKMLSDIALKKEKIVPIPYGSKIITPSYTKQEARAKLSLDPKVNYALFFGVLREDKGIVELIENFSKVDSSLHLIIAGSEGNISYEKVKELIRKNNLQERCRLWLKYLDDEEIELFHIAADFIFIPHKKHHFAFSGPLSMAVQYETPVIATDIGEIGYFVKKYKIGNTFRSNDFNDLVKVTNGIVNEKGVDYQDNFRACQQENSWEMMASHISEIYRKE